MAEKRNSRDDNPRFRKDGFRKDELNLSHSLNADNEVDEDSEDQEDEESKATGLAGVVEKLKDLPGQIKDNPNLLKGMASTIRRSDSASIHPVCVGSGATAFTVIPKAPTSIAIALVNASTAALLEP